MSNVSKSLRIGLLELVKYDLLEVFAQVVRERLCRE